MARKKKPGSGDEGSTSDDSLEMPTTTDEAGAPESDNVVPFKKKGNGEDAEADRKAGERLTRLNDQYCVVKDGGKVRVMEFRQTYYGSETRRVPMYMTAHDFKDYLQNRRVVSVGPRGGVSSVGEGEWWLEHPGRRTYEALVFDPSREREFDGKLNLWQGWGVEEGEGNWSLMRSHIEEVICSGEREQIEYVMNWVAWAFQHPGEPAEVVLVLRGRMGIGKGAFTGALRIIFGQHSFQASSHEHIVGRFTIHLRDTALLVGDEAFWPGRASEVGKLRTLITESNIVVEGKGTDAIQTKNCLKIVMSSNENWVVPAGENERRFVVMDVSDARMQDESYFKPLFAQMDAGGYSAMLHDLRRRDIGDWHPRRIISTAALQRQQEISMLPFDKWLVSVLIDAVIPGHDPADPTYSYSGDHDHIIDAEGFTGSRSRRGLLSSMRHEVPMLGRESDQDLARMLVDIGCKRDKKYAGRKQHRGWVFPPLTEMRARFNVRYPGIKFDDTEKWTTDILAPARGTE
jgi:hypothetical protein